MQITEIIKTTVKHQLQEYRKNSRNVLKGMRGEWLIVKGKSNTNKQGELMRKDCLDEGRIKPKRETSGVFGTQTYRSTAVHYKRRVWGGEKKRKEQI